MHMLRVFARVAQRASFAAAAEDLHMSRASVSKYVAAIEDRLGARLLDRTTRSVSLTEAGRVYLERCLECLQAYDDSEAAIGGLTAEPKGRLRVAAPFDFNRHLPALITQFMGESIAMALVAFLLAVGLLFELLPVFNDLTGKHLTVSDLNGSFLLGLSTLPFLYNVWLTNRKGTKVEEDDPWGYGRSLEWATSCPPPRHNFAGLPRIRSECPAFDLHHRDPERRGMEHQLLERQPSLGNHQQPHRGSRRSCP